MHAWHVCHVRHIHHYFIRCIDIKCTDPNYRRVPQHCVRFHSKTHLFYDSMHSADWNLIKQNMQSIMALNPTFSSSYFDNEKCEKYIREHLGDEMASNFGKETSGAYKADIFRLVVLYFEGGYYLDVDLDMKLPIQSFIDDDIMFTTVIAKDTKNVFQAFLGSVAKHPIIAINLNLMYAYYRGELQFWKLCHSSFLGVTLMRLAILEYTKQDSLDEVAYNGKQRGIQLLYECSALYANCPAYHWQQKLSQDRQCIVWDKVKWMLSGANYSNVQVLFYSRVTSMEEWKEAAGEYARPWPWPYRMFWVVRGFSNTIWC